MESDEAFEAAVRRHDAQVKAAGLTLWVGSEPTFTDRHLQSPPWLNQALGTEKEARARALLVRLCRRFPGSLVLRSAGRLYPGEDEPRWCLGLYRRRDGTALWHGPADPMLVATDDPPPLPDLVRFAADLGAELQRRGFTVTTATEHDAPQRRHDDAGRATAQEPVAALARLALQICASLGSDPQTARVHRFKLSLTQDGDRPTACVELPPFDAISDFMLALESLHQAGGGCRWPALVITGCPPPVDASVELTTLTPDPAVIEINTAPSVDAEDFLRRSRAVYAAAADEGLSPYRLYFNGAVADSGGGGQITLGGPTPETSPFLLHPLLLPRLVGFFNRHPALSYFFSHDHVGSGGQSARADERGSDAFDELQLALSLLGREPGLPPRLLWQSLAPFLCDASGNSHRAEINIEKLWNPFLPGRGQLGLVELRALRMQHTPQRATALACLLRAVTAMLVGAHAETALVDWGRELHDRFALPFYLEQDLDAVLQALDTAGQGLGKPLRDTLLRDEFRLLGTVPLPGCTLELWRALEFWPLLGDVASPEQVGTSRLVDASTARVELRLRPAPLPGDDGRAWRVFTHGVELPLRRERDARGELAVFGLRYRSFVPMRGLHPMLGAQAPVQLLLRHPASATDHCVSLHEWQPAGEAYAGLPQDLAEASRRRAERLTVACVPRASRRSTSPRPSQGLSPYALDLRCLR